MTATVSHHIVQPIFTDAGMHTLLCYYYDKVPTVQSETRVMEYFTITLDGKTMHYFTHREAEEFLHAVLDANNPDDAKLLSRGVQRHYGAISIYSFLYDDTLLSAPPHDVYIEPVRVRRAMRSLYTTFVEHENRLARIFGFPSLHTAMQHDYVRTLLKVYPADELVSFYHAEVAPHLDSLAMLRERFDHAVEHDILNCYPNPMAPRERAEVQEINTIADNAVVTLEHDFLHRLYTSLATVAQQHDTLPLAWVMHAGDESCEQIVNSMDTALTETLADLKALPRAQEEYDGSATC